MTDAAAEVKDGGWGGLLYLKERVFKRMSKKAWMKVKMDKVGFRNLGWR